MKITPINNSPRVVQLGSLKAGDTFMFDSKIGMIASRNGHDFPLELATGHEFWMERPMCPWTGFDNPATLRPDTEVIPVNCELRCQICL